MAQKQQFAADMPQLDTPVQSLTEDEVVGGSMQVTRMDDLRITAFALIYDPVSTTANLGELKNFLSISVGDDESAAGTNEYNGDILQKLFTPWLTRSNDIFSGARARRILRRLRDAPLKISFTLDPRNENALADVIDVTHRKVVDQTGAAATKRMRVVRTLNDGLQEVDAVITALKQRDAVIAPNATADYPTDETYAHISLNTGLMSDGTDGYTIA